MKAKSANTHKDNPKRNFRKIFSWFTKHSRNVSQTSKKVVPTHIANEENKIEFNIKKDNEPSSRKKISLANAIAFLALIISVLAFWRNETSIDTAKESVRVADSSARFSKQSADASDTSAEVAKKSLMRQDISNEISRSAVTISEKSYESSVMMNQKTLNAQIQSLKETQKQFAITNEPYLQIDEISLDSLLPNRKKKFTYHITNLGNYPAKMIKSKFVPVFTNVKDTHSYDRKHPPNFGNPVALKNFTYLIKGVPDKNMDEYDQILSQGKYDSLKKGQMYMYLVGRIIYETIAPPIKEKSYDFLIEFDIPNNGMIYKYNENIDYIEVK